MPPQPGLRLVEPQELSDPASPEPVYGFEPLWVIGSEIAPLLRRHFREMAVHQRAIPYDPNWEAAAQLAAAKMLHVLTVRVGDALVGYIVNIVQPHNHHRSSLHAWLDLVWLNPVHRRGWTGYRMFVENERHLRQLGVKRIMVGEKLHWRSKRDKRVRVILRRLGYGAMDVVYAKLLT